MDRDDRDELIRYLTERRLAAKRNVTNRTRMRELITGDLVVLDTFELQVEYDEATGASRPTNADAVDYRYSPLDHAVSDAVHLLGRQYHGAPTFTDADVAYLLTEEHGPAIAGRALSLAADGAYRETIPASARRPTGASDAPTLTLAEYIATADAPPTIAP